MQAHVRKRMSASACPQAHARKRMPASVCPQANMVPISTCKCRERQLGAALAAERARQRARPQAHVRKRMPASEHGTYQHM